MGPERALECVHMIPRLGVTTLLWLHISRETTTLGFLKLVGSKKWRGGMG
jgi:hypothetical protein